MNPQVDTQTPCPKALSVTPENIPTELKKINAWVVWKYEPSNDEKKWTKVPYQLDGRTRASTTDPATWGSFPEALNRYNDGGVDGIGIVLSKDLGIVGIDLDHCYDQETRKVEKSSMDIIQKMDSYSEFSPSGEGIRIFVKGSLPEGVTGRKKGNIEIYQAVRYLTVTGHASKGRPQTIEARQEAINEFYAQVFEAPKTERPKSNRNNGRHLELDDDVLLEKAFAARNGQKIGRLYDGDFSEYPSQSEADLALCSCLGFWTEDSTQLDRLFRNSSLMREKWDEKHGTQTYGEMIIGKVLSGNCEHYQGSHHDGGKNSWSSFFSSPVDQPRPELKSEALYGLAGDIVRGIEPHSEADPTAILVNVLVGFGNLVGPAPYTRVEETQHHINLFAVQVGATSKGRKGQAWSTPRKMFRDVEPEWADKRITGGLSSGEGLVYNVRDPRFATKPIREDGKVVGYEEILVDKGEEDKRLLLIEEEFSQALKVMSREGNILSPIIRQAWDHGNLRSLTKNDPNRATGAHISIIAHITRGELLRHLVENEQTNGFGNRFLWVCVSRSKSIPEPEPVAREILHPLTERIREAVNFARSVGEMRRTPEARAEWAMVYPELSDAKPGLAGAMMARGEAQVLRLSCLYALMDQSDSIGVEHQRAALALWEYSEQSVRAIFGGLSGDPNVDMATAALMAKGQLTLTEMHGLFGRNVAATEIERVIGVLIKTGLATVETVVDERGRKSITVIRATNSTKSTKSTA